jgi:hypothetical protein
MLNVEIWNLNRGISNVGIVNVWFLDFEISKTFETFKILKIENMKVWEFWNDSSFEILCIFYCCILKFWKVLKILILFFQSLKILKFEEFEFF